MQTPKLINAYQRMLQTQGGKSPLTIKNYLSDLNKFIAHLNGKSLLAVIVDDIRTFLLERKQGGEKAAGLNRKLSALRSFYNWLLDEKRLIQNNPTRTISRFKDQDRKQTIKSLTPEDVKHVLLNITRLRDRALFLLIVSTGIRLKEAVALNIDDLDFSTFPAKVIIRQGKGNTTRTVYPSDQAVKALKEYLSQRDDLGEALFLSREGNRLAGRTIQTHFANYFQQAGVDATVHSLRHSFAVHRLKKGVQLKELQQFLGHKSITSTQIYTTLDDEHLGNVAKDTEIEY